VLLGADPAPLQRAQEQLLLLLQRPVERLEALSKQTMVSSSADSHSFDGRAPLADDLLDGAADAAFQISAVAVVSKGCTALSRESTPLREIFSRATHAALMAMAAFGAVNDVRAKVLVLLHRMVETLGETVLPYLDSAVPQLLRRADATELVELLTLVNQLVLKFKSNIRGPMTVLFSPLAAAAFAHLHALETAIAASSAACIGVVGPASDEVRERRGLLRSFFSLVHSLVHSDLTQVLEAPPNAEHVPSILRVLLSGCLEGPDLHLQRQCFVILQCLVESWVGSAPGFDTYVLREVLPVCFSAAAQPHFCVKDVAALALLESSAALQKAIHAKLGADLVDHLRAELLPSLGCTVEIASEFIRTLCDADVRHLRDFIATNARERRSA